jgi:putative Mn2+ efflux pump MntP
MYELFLQYGIKKKHILVCFFFLYVISVIFLSLGLFLAVVVTPIIIAWHVWLCFLLLLVLVGEFVRNLCKPRTSGPKKGHSNEGFINGWDKGENYVNPSTETHRL